MTKTPNRLLQDGTCQAVDRNSNTHRATFAHGALMPAALPLGWTACHRPQTGLSARARPRLQKVEALQAEIAELAKLLRYEVSVRAKQQGWTEKACRYHFKKNLRRIVSDLYVRDNCHPVKASLLVWVQLPMWISLSLALRNISLGLADSTTALQGELAVGGVLWFPDLSLPDSTWIMPVCLGLVNLIIVEIFSLRRTEASKFQKYVTNFIRGISLVMIPIAATVPSSMALYWLSSSCVGLGHNLLLRSPRFRRLCRIPPTRSDSATPYRDLAAAFTIKYLK